MYVYIYVCVLPAKDAAELTAAEEAGAHVEPCRAMNILVGKPFQTQDNLFMTEWVAIFRESGFRDDVTVHRLQDACLKLVVFARARAHDMQVDFQVEKANEAIVPKSVVTKPALPVS